MNFKKFISGVSALTIAASAFAGMAVTANAADHELTSTAVYQSDSSTITANPSTPTTYSCQYRGDSTTAAPIKTGTGSSLVLYTFDISEVSGTVTSATFTADLTGSGDGKYIASMLYLGYNGDPTTGTLNNGAMSGTSDGTATNARPFQSLNDTDTWGSGTAFPYSYDKNATKYVKSAVDADKDTVTFAIIHNSTRAAHWGATAKLDINVTTASATGYTVKYVGPDGETEIKTADTSRTATPGETVSITNDDKAVIAYGGTTYYYESDNASSLDLNAENPTITVRFRAAVPYTARLNLVNSSSILDTKTSVVADTSLKTRLYYPVMIENNGEYFYKGSSGDTAGYWSVEATSASDETPLSVTYSKMDKVVYYAEFAAATGGTKETTYSNRYSDGDAYVGATMDIALGSGTYDVYVGMRNGGSGDRTVGIYDGTTTIDSKSVSRGSTSELCFSDIEISDSKTITVKEANTSNVALDYVYIIKTGPTAEITEYSYEQYDASLTDAKTDEDITAVKLFIETTGTVSRLGLEYNNAAKYAKNLSVMTDATIVLGAIIPGHVDVDLDTFKTVVE